MFNSRIVKISALCLLGYTQLAWSLMSVEDSYDVEETETFGRNGDLLTAPPPAPDAPPAPVDHHYETEENMEPPVLPHHETDETHHYETEGGMGEMLDTQNVRNGLKVEWTTVLTTATDDVFEEIEEEEPEQSGGLNPPGSGSGSQEIIWCDGGLINIESTDAEFDLEAYISHTGAMDSTDPIEHISSCVNPAEGEAHEGEELCDCYDPYASETTYMHAYSICRNYYFNMLSYTTLQHASIPVLREWYHNHGIHKVTFQPNHADDSLKSEDSAIDSHKNPVQDIIAFCDSDIHYPDEDGSCGQIAVDQNCEGTFKLPNVWPLDISVRNVGQCF